MVVDTDVVAAALLGEEGRGTESALLLTRAKTLMAPAHWKAELANVVWKAVVFAGLDANRVETVLDAAASLSLAEIDVAELWRGAVARAMAARHPVYDTLFVELAVREGIPMASYDQSLRRKFPTVVRSPASLLRRAKA